MTLTIEAREYNEDSTPEEIEALRARVRFHEGIAVLFEEVPVMSYFQCGVCFGRVGELLREHDCHAVIVDASQAKPPNALLRERTNDLVRNLYPRLTHITIATGKNVMLNVIARFILAKVPQKVDVCRTLDEAEVLVRRGLSKSSA